MFRIGDFSRLCMVPVSALRYYADLGLLEPAAVDPSSGYRYYTAAQLRLVNRIVALKELGLALDEIRAVLSESLGAGELRGMLRLKEAEASRRVAEEQQRLERVEARLRLIEQEGRMPEQEVVVKSVPEVRGLGMRAKVAGPAGMVVSSPKKETGTPSPWMSRSAMCIAQAFSHIRSTLRLFASIMPSTSRVTGSVAVWRCPRTSPRGATNAASRSAATTLIPVNPAARSRIPCAPSAST